MSRRICCLISRGSARKDIRDVIMVCDALGRGARLFVAEVHFLKAFLIGAGPIDAMGPLCLAIVLLRKRVLVSRLLVGGRQFVLV